MGNCSPIGCHSVTRNELKYENVHKGQTTQKFDSKTENNKKEQVGKDQEKAQSEKDSHSKNRGGKKQTNNQVLIS